MFKNLTGGAVINYGPTLPTGDVTFDGALFYKTTGTDQGLHIYGFVQDANLNVVGDQSIQGWTQVQSPGLYVDVAGDIMTGNLQMAGTSQIIFSNNFGSVDSTDPMTFINNGETIWRGTTGGPHRMHLTNTPGILKVNGDTVWHSGNDWDNAANQNSQLNAGLFQGQTPSYYLNAANMQSGVLSVDRLPFTPVQQGGGPGQGVGSSHKINIGWGLVSGGGSGLLLNVDSTNFANDWPININGIAQTANYAYSAGNAANATNAASATTVPWTGVSGRPTNLSSFTNDVGFVTAASGSYLGRGNDVWQTSAEGLNRFYFGTNGPTTYMATGGHTFKNSPNTTLLTLDGSGNLVATGDVTAFSDRRLKKDIVKIDNAVAKVEALTGITYKRIDNSEVGTGLIAQDVQAVLPEAVHTQEFDGMLSVSYGNLAGLFVEAIKELKAEVNTLRAELDSLKAR